jgi:hypothetical protein
MEQSERRWLIIFIIFVLLITTIPYVIAYSHNPTEWEFTGFVFGVEDGNSYIAKMLTGEYGAWLFRSPYSAYPQRGFLAFLPYILLGKLVSPPDSHIQLVVLFQLFRWVAAAMMIFATYQFISLFLKDHKLRRWAVVIATIGGGLGWLSLLGLQKLWWQGLPLEFYSPESFGFLSLYGLPHLAAARAFLLWGLIAFMKEKQRVFPGFQTGLLWLAAGFFQPITVAVGWAILGGYLAYNFLISWIRNRRNRIKAKKIWTWKSHLRTAMIAILISSPWVIYNLVSFNVDPYLRGWEAQNIITSPPLLDYLLAYGILLPFAIAGLVSLIRRSEWQGNLLVAWIFLFPILAYAPHNLQRRLPDGIWVALTVTAFIFIERNWELKMPKLAYSTALTLITPLVLIAGGSIMGSSQSTPVFRPYAETSAFEFISETVSPGSVVLATYQSANAMPAWAPVRLLTGHGPESINFNAVNDSVNHFYQASTQDSDRMALIDEFHIAYVFWGPEERNNGSWDPNQADYLTSLYSQDGYQVFRVNSQSIGSAP